ncbi:HNH endonuclease [Vibrio phage D292]
MADLNKILSQTKVRLMMSPKSGFISSVLMALDVQYSEEVPTACTSGTSISINPKFFADLPPNQRLFLLLHEAWHVVYEHPWAMRSSDNPDILNQAQDHYINLSLVKDGFEFIPGGCKDEKYVDWTVKAIYEDLLKNGSGSGSGGIGRDVQPTKGDEAKAKETKVRVQEIICKAAMAAELGNQAGSIPEDVKRMIEEIRNPKLPWHQVLENYMQERVREEHSWNRRNKRYPDVYLPSLAGEGMGEIRSYVDASGSISNKELGLEVAEMVYVKEMVNPTRMSITAFACHLGKEQAFERDEEIEFDVDVGGGTNLHPVWADIQNAPETEVVIIFTDGYVDVPPAADLDCDVIFVIVNNPSWQHPDFTVIHMEIGHDD